MTKHSAASAKWQFGKRRSTARSTRYCKRKGEMAELIFVVKAISMGFAVCRPYGNSEAYDMAVEENGRFLRIQVKSVFTSARWGYSVAVSRQGSHRHTVQYTAQEIDFIGAYVVPHDAWYIVPVEEIVSRAHIRFYPGGTKKRDGGRYEKYREAWDLLRRGAARSSEGEMK